MPRARGTPVRPANESAHAAAELLPPAEQIGAGLVSEYLADATTGLPESARTMERADYRSRLKLDYISQPSFGAGATRFGPALSGGVLAYFSDMLGNRQLAAAVQAQGTFKDVGAQVVYRNSARRWNWGTAAAHIPYLTVGTIATGDAQGNLIVAQVLDRVFVDQAAAFAARPFSQTRRLEVNGGFTRLSYDREIREYLLAPTGQIIDERTTDGVETLRPLTFFEISTALVGDNASFAFTSPVAGQRYRLEISPTFGALQYQTTLADYRRYVFAKPISFAFRALHYGRHGRNGDDPRLTPLFLGYETFIRGYAVESFDTAECTTNENDNACPEFERLSGSRIAVANFEVRIPLFGTEGLGLVKLPMLPTEISPFLDMGMAWWGRSATDPLSGKAVSRPRLAFERNTLARVPVVSTGVTARINLSGYFILQAYYAYPFQRPGKGPHFGFNIAPGW